MHIRTSAGFIGALLIAAGCWLLFGPGAAGGVLLALGVLVVAADFLS